MANPTYNAEGQAIWKPQPGQVFPDGLRYVHSYGGIVSALKDIQVASGHIPKPYPNNFAGIIAAIEDLKDYINEGNLPDVGAPPPGWEIIVNPDGSVDGDWIVVPPDGSLWFDTRQGRMFIAIDGEYVQTNGGDGIAHVGETAPTNPPVIGATWLDPSTGLFYVFIGPDPDDPTQGIWQAVTSDGDITLTTATLPLAIGRETFEIYEPKVIPDPDVVNMRVQKDFNQYVYACILALDQGLAESAVSVGDTPPTENVVPGTLWYDSRTLELSIYYQDNDSAQWVPVSVGYEINEITGALNDKIARESTTRAAAIDHIYSMVSSLDAADDARVDGIEANLATLTNQVNSISIPDVTPYATNALLDAAVERIISLETAEIDFTPYATQASLSNAFNTLDDKINSQTHLELSDITPLIPDVSAKVEQSDIDTAIAGLGNTYIARAGGRLDGTLVINKAAVGNPAIDASGDWYTGNNLFKLQSYNPTGKATTFGTTNNYWEVAWKFASDEDFAWIYNDTDKVFSISKDGPACSQLYIGQFRDNDSNGRSLRNKIEVGQTLRDHSSTFTSIKQAISRSTDFDSLKTNLLQALSNV